MMMAEPTGLEPATSSVTGKRSNQLSYGSRISTSLKRCHKDLFGCSSWTSLAKGWLDDKRNQDKF
jgi:hypothetical protein